ncbi:cell division protein FtsL [soil metagenome]
MNATVRVVGQGAMSARSITNHHFVISSGLLSVLTLMLLVFASALATVYIKDMNRILFSELQSLKRTSNALSVEWGQLLLEQSTWATQARTETIAAKQLVMQRPQQKHLIMIEKSAMRLL